MQTSPLQLDDAFIGEITVTPNESTALGVAPSNVVVNATPSYARHNENPIKWSVKLLVEFQSGETAPSPYEGHVQCEGYFTVVNTEQTEAKQRKLVAVNAPTILYSMARDMVATITGQSRRGKFLLPAVSFIDQIITFPDDPKPEDHASSVAPVPPV